MSTLRAIVAWRPQTPFYYGWLVLAVSAAGSFAGTGLAQQVLGAVQTLLIEDLDTNRSTIAWAATIGTWTAGMLAPVIGWLVDRYGPRYLMPFGAVVAGTVLFLISGTSSVTQFVAAYILGRSVVNPILINVVPRTVAVNFFLRRRNVALGLTSMSRPVGAATLIQAISLIARWSSWRVAYRMLGGFSLVLVVPLFLVMRRRPEDIGLLPDGDSSPARTRGPETGRYSVVEANWTASEAVRTSALWLIVAANALIIVTSGAITFQAVPFLQDSGLSQAIAALALSVSTLLGALPGPLWGYAADRWPPRRLFLICLAAGSTIIALFLFLDGGYQRLVLIIVWGTSIGGLGVLGQMMLARYFGRRSFGSIIGLTGPFQTGALGLGPTFGAYLFRATDGYSAMFIAGLATYAAAFALIYSVRPPRKPARIAETREEESAS